MHAQRAGQLTEVERSTCGDDDEHAELHERDLVLDSAIDRAITETRTREARIARPPVRSPPGSVALPEPV